MTLQKLLEEIKRLKEQMGLAEMEGYPSQHYDKELKGIKKTVEAVDMACIGWRYEIEKGTWQLIKEAVK